MTSTAQAFSGGFEATTSVTFRIGATVFFGGQSGTLIGGDDTYAVVVVGDAIETPEWSIVSPTQPEDIGDSIDTMPAYEKLSPFVQSLCWLLVTDRSTEPLISPIRSQLAELVKGRCNSLWASVPAKRRQR